MNKFLSGFIRAGRANAGDTFDPPAVAATADTTIECQWCGDVHEIDRLCARAQHGMTRRSFLFMAGAGLAAAAMPTLPNVERPFSVEQVARIFNVPERMLSPMPIGRVLYHGSSDGRAWKELARFDVAVDAVVVGNGEIYGTLEGRRVAPVTAPNVEARYVRASITSAS